MGSFENFAYNVLRLGVKRGRPPVFSAQQFYPAKEERELQETLKRELERLWTAALQVALQGIRDDVSDLAQIRAELSEDFVNNVNGIADKIIGNAQKSLVKFSEMTIGRPYYPGALEGSIKADWTATFQQLCISADTTAKAKIAQLVSQGKDQGMNKLQIEKLVKSELPADTAHRAELIARTETAKLNNAATMASYREAGIEYYKWLSCIDDRTRESHAKLNGKICAVGRPDVYFEENDENPLKPISHGRAGEGMYIGDPGTDFQCRCTCVPWDPRIDGKFEIKEAPEPKPKEPSKLEIAREETAAEKARAEEAERKLRLLQRSIERHSERTAKDVEGITAAWEARNSKWRILHAAEKRHAARNEAKIIAEMQERIKVRAEGRAILAELEGISGIDLDKMREALKTGNVSEIKNAQKVLETIKSEIQNLVRLDNPMEVAKTWGLHEAKVVNENVERTLGRWTGSSLNELKGHLEFEIQWVEKHKKYKTWEVAKKAYEKELKRVVTEIEWQDVGSKADAVIAILSGSKSVKAKSAINAIKEAKAKGNIEEYKKEIEAAEKLSEKLSKSRKSTSNTGNRTEYEGSDLSWSKFYDNVVSDRKDYSGSLLIEKILKDQRFDALPQLVEKEQFRDLLKKDHYLATRTYGTDYRGEVQKLTIDAREDLYNKNFFVRCIGGNVHGFGMYFGCDPKLGKNARDNKRIWRDYKKQYSYEEFCCLSKNAKIIAEDNVEKEFLKRGKDKAPSQRMKDAIVKHLNGRWISVENFGEEVKKLPNLTSEELKFIKGGFCFYKDVPDADLMKEPRKLPLHRDSWDVGVLAAKMGYDALYDSRTNYGVMLNRSKMILLNRNIDKRTTEVIFSEEFGV